MSACPFCALTPEIVATMTDDEAKHLYTTTNASHWCDGHAMSALNVQRMTDLTGRKLVEAILRYVSK